jgi:hypothetical protein
LPQIKLLRAVFAFLPGNVRNIPSFKWSSHFIIAAGVEMNLVV